MTCAAKSCPVCSLQQSTLSVAFRLDRYKPVRDYLARAFNSSGKDHSEAEVRRIICEACHQPLLRMPEGPPISFCRTLALRATALNRKYWRPENHPIVTGVAEHIVSARLKRALLDGRYNPWRPDAAPLDAYVLWYATQELRKRIREVSGPGRRHEDVILDNSQKAFDEADRKQAEEEDPLEPLSRRTLDVDVQIKGILKDVIIDEVDLATQLEPHILNLAPARFRKAAPGYMRVVAMLAARHPRLLNLQDQLDGLVASEAARESLDLFSAGAALGAFLPEINGLAMAAEAGRSNGKQTRDAIEQMMVAVLAKDPELLRRGREIRDLRAELCVLLETRLLAHLGQAVPLSKELQSFANRVTKRLDLYRRPFLIISPNLL